MNNTSAKTVPLVLNSILFIAGIGFSLIHQPILCIICFLLISLLFIWTFKPDFHEKDFSDWNADEEHSADSGRIYRQMSDRLRELAESNSVLSEENRQLEEELRQYRAEQSSGLHPIYSCPLTSALPVSLNTFFTDYLKSHADRLEAHGLHCEYNCPAAGTDTYLSPAALTLICDNAFDNMLKFSPSPAAVYIRISSGEETTLIIFKNEGSAPDAGETDAIFDLNYQGVNRKAGNGLGLAQVKALVEDFGGQVWARSAKENGFTLYIQLPNIKKIH